MWVCIIVHRKQKPPCLAISVGLALIPDTPFGLRNGILTSWCPGSAKYSALHVDSVKWHSAPLCYIQIWWELHWQRWQREIWWPDRALDNHRGSECVIVSVSVHWLCAYTASVFVYLCGMGCREDLLFWELPWWTEEERYTASVWMLRGPWVFCLSCFIHMGIFVQV